MKPDEIFFFKVCYLMRTAKICTVRDVVHMFEGFIHYKRCWYLLDKWSRIGFYSYGVTLDLGWFESVYNMPERYKKLFAEYDEQRGCFKSMYIDPMQEGLVNLIKQGGKSE